MLFRLVYFCLLLVYCLEFKLFVFFGVICIVSCGLCLLRLHISLYLISLVVCGFRVGCGCCLWWFLAGL